MNKLQWNFSRNFNISIQENEPECVVCEMAAILSRPQRVKLEVQAMDSITVVIVYPAVIFNAKLSNQSGKRIITIGCIPYYNLWVNITAYSNMFA